MGDKNPFPIPFKGVPATTAPSNVWFQGGTKKTVSKPKGGIVDESAGQKYEAPLSSGPTSNGTAWAMPTYTPPKNIQPWNKLDPNWVPSATRDAIPYVPGAYKTAVTPTPTPSSTVAAALKLPTSANSPVGSNPAAATSVQAPPAVDPNAPVPIDLDKLYATLEARLGELNAGQQQSYQEQARKVAANWADTNAETQKAYDTTLNPLQEQARQLGVGNADAFFTPNRTALNNLLEGNRANAAGDQSFFDKMIADRKGGLQDLIAQAEAQKLTAKNAQQVAMINYATEKAKEAAALAAKSSGGGGGGSGKKKSGSGSSKSSVSTTATQTDTVSDPQALAAINEISKTNPALGASMMATYNRENGSPFVKGLQGNADAVSSVLSAAGYKPSTAAKFAPAKSSPKGGIKAETGQSQLYGGAVTPGAMKTVSPGKTLLNQIMKVLAPLSGQPVTKQTVTTKGK